MVIEPTGPAPPIPEAKQEEQPGAIPNSFVPMSPNIEKPLSPNLQHVQITVMDFSQKRNAETPIPNAKENIPPKADVTMETNPSFQQPAAALAQNANPPTTSWVAAKLPAREQEESVTTVLGPQNTKHTLFCCLPFQLNEGSALGVSSQVHGWNSFIPLQKSSFSKYVYYINMEM